MKYAILMLLTGILFLLNNCTNSNEERNDQVGLNWPVYGGNNAGNRYSPLNQVNTKNVHRLTVAWEYHTGENKVGERGFEIQCQPIIIDGVLYGTTPQLKVFAIKADTGSELWTFDPFKGVSPQYHANRGVSYWEDGDEKRILFTAGSYLYAVDAVTGQVINVFL